MPFQVNVQLVPGYVELIYQGQLSPDEVERSAIKSMVAARGNNLKKILADCSELLGGHSIIDLYGLIELFAADRTGPRIKEALIMPTLPVASDNVRFWETACINRGLDVRIFNDRESALEWLFP